MVPEPLGMRAGAGATVLTDNQGRPVSDNENSVTAGERGPVLLEDYHLLEKNAIFNRRKIPERTVHARGHAMKGYFEVTHDITHLSKAAVFSEVGKRTPVHVRLSTVTGERGSPESLRDIRGFSVKLYTDEGNWDFVGNSTPTFFIKDAQQFPDLNKALAPDPRSHLQRGWRILDFLSHHPESLLQMFWLLGDRGTPYDYIHMEGFGIHTFVLINKEGKETYCKFKWEPKAGVKIMTDEEAVKAGTANNRHSHATQNAYEAIENGDYPEWTLNVQLMDPAKEDEVEFDPLDSTKIWPEEDYPLHPVGKMVLKQNVDNWFAENEMVAFNPGVVPPGIAPSNDKLLQGRIHAYSDAQRYRLGVNYLLLPVNRPRNEHFNGNFEGFMNFAHRAEDVDYQPSRVAPVPDLVHKEGHLPAHMSQMGIGGKKTRSKTDQDNVTFKQCRAFYHGTFDDKAKERFQEHLVTFLAEPQCKQEIRDVWIGWMHKVDDELGNEIEKQLAQQLGQKKGQQNGQQNGHSNGIVAKAKEAATNMGNKAAEAVGA